MTFEEWVATQTERPIGLKSAWEAAYKEGQKAMRTRAEAVCVRHWTHDGCSDDCIQEIIDLPIEDE